MQKNQFSTFSGSSPQIQHYQLHWTIALMAQKWPLRKDTCVAVYSHLDTSVDGQTTSEVKDDQLI